jgi:hypothetical protein
MNLTTDHRKLPDKVAYGTEKSLYRLLMVSSDVVKLFMNDVKII